MKTEILKSKRHKQMALGLDHNASCKCNARNIEIHAMTFWLLNLSRSFKTPPTNVTKRKNTCTVGLGSPWLTATTLKL